VVGAKALVSLVTWVWAVVAVMERMLMLGRERDAKVDSVHFGVGRRGRLIPLGAGALSVERRPSSLSLHELK
jgi:hypothetical protein